ncbi:MAG TPA: RodZ domain-containing protein [Gaiellaceae bacterium]|nr:RodZ domain-containing protein [Gaiellaceae bacterium]
MFEIGNSLREARLRQQLELPELEQQTKIRSKYLKALEDEKFELLPAPTYVRGFLRSYADALGLEGQLYVDEYNSRFITGDEDVPLRPRDYQRRPQPMRHRFETRAVVLTVGAIAVVFALVIAAWKFGSSNETAAPTLPNVPQTAVNKHARRHVVPMARLVLTAATGDTWLQVRAGGATGAVKYEGTLQQGQQLAFTRRPFLFRRLWLAVGKPANLVAKVNGRVRLIPGHGEPARLLVTPRAIVKAPPAA